MEKDPDEIIHSLIVSCRQVKKLFQQKRISDAKTISALAFCGLL